MSFRSLSLASLRPWQSECQRCTLSPPHCHMLTPTGYPTMLSCTWYPSNIKHNTHEEFHGHKCTDSVLVQQRDASHNLSYAKLLLMFKISVSGEEHDIVFIQDYAVASPADMSEDDKATGFRKLILGGLESTYFILPDSIIRSAFIVNTDDIHENHYFINDLVDTDMYLRLM